MVIIRGTQTSAALYRPREGAPVLDPLEEQAVEVLAGELAADRIPSVRAIRAALHVGQPGAQRLREYLAAVADTDDGGLAA